MCEKNFPFWCCALLLLVSSSSKSQENSTNNEEKDDNLTVRYELDMNSTINYVAKRKTSIFDWIRLSKGILNKSGNIPNLIDTPNYIIEIKCVSKIVSILLLVSIFLVYSILPELRNVHGFMLRNYSGALFVAYIFEIVSIIIKADDVQHSVCITIVQKIRVSPICILMCARYYKLLQPLFLFIFTAFFDYFLFLTTFFWLIMISFDMWWTFRGFCSLQRNARRQREKRKLVYYAICAWGCPFIFAIISVIMEVVPNDLPKILRPEFVAGNCWFGGFGAFMLYYYGLKSVLIISSICLSISTALKIACYERDTGLRRTDSESKRYNDNKKWWFKLYLKLFIVLFIVMGIRWSIVAVSWFVNISNCVSYFMELMDIIPNLCTFIIFVWKKKIKRMLLKRFDCGLFPEARCETNVTSSTCTTTSEVYMQEKMNSCRQENYHVKGSSVGTEL